MEPLAHLSVPPEATPADPREAAACRALEREALEAFDALAVKNNLPTRAVRAHVFVGRKRMILWHQPQGTLPDTRSFEGEFRRRVRCQSVELRAVGPREAAAVLGGCGCCGRALCCAAGRCPAREPSPQDVARLAGAAGPMAVNGLCGCPKCCLEF